MHHFGSRIDRIIAAALLIGTGAYAAETKTEMNVKLPPFIVESTIGPTWRYLEIPRFEILSRCNDPTTERIALAFHRANQLLTLVLPDRFQLELAAPQKLIFYDEKLWPVAEQQAVAAMLRSGRSYDVPAPGAVPKVRLEPIGHDQLPVRERASKSTVSDAFFSNLMLTDADTIVTFALVSEATLDPQRSYLMPAYVRTILENRAPALPDWFTAGFMRLYDRMDFDRHTVAVKPLRWDEAIVQRAREENDEIAGDALRSPTPRLKARRALELGQQPITQGAPGEQFRRDAPITSSKQPAPEPELRLPLAGLVEGIVPAGDLGPWLAQGELMVSWGLDPANGRAEAFWNWIDRLAREPATEALFYECMRMDYAAAARSVVTYATTHQGMRWVLPEAERRPPPFPLRDATPREIARIKGEWERLETRYVRKNQPALEEHYNDLARRTLRKPHDRGDRDAQLLASLGLLELEAGDKTASRAFLEEATEAGVRRPRAYYELARLRYDYLVGRSTRNDGKFLAEQTDPILQSLLAAAKQTPPLAAVYELMAQVCFMRVEPPSDEVLAALAEGVRLFPRDENLRRQIAALVAGGPAPPDTYDLLHDLNSRLPRPKPSH